MQCTILLLFANGGVVVLPVIVFAVLFHIRMSNRIVLWFLFLFLPLFFAEWICVRVQKCQVQFNNIKWMREVKGTADRPTITTKRW